MKVYEFGSDYAYQLRLNQPKPKPELKKEEDADDRLSHQGSEVGVELESKEEQAEPERVYPKVSSKNKKKGKYQKK